VTGKEGSEEEAGDHCHKKKMEKHTQWMNEKKER